ncbi:MAG: pyruvate ferredoxin oxidoreductase, partial [Methanomicrobiales archaeon]|nr:pyruvate ferredoxin oxidoreductase [Methanomicrobiales archaeon]
SGQTELFFVQHAGQGEFPRFIVAPGNAAEAYSWSAVALNLGWKYQTPAFILTDKNLSEGGFSLDLVTSPPSPEWSPPSEVGSSYKRYALTESGISPFIPFAAPGAVVKYNGYCHDEQGISTERPELVTIMQEKLLRKQQSLEKEISNIPSVNRLGVVDAATTLLCWGSCRGVCEEVAEHRRLRVVQPVVLCPFPVEQVRRALEGSDRVIAVEYNATGQLATLMLQHGFTIHHQIHKYDGRPFTIEELEERVKGVLG